MARKTKKGYLWVFDQQDKWDDIASEKISQLEDVRAMHLDWFNKHSTVSQLLALRRPDSKKAHESISKASSQIVPIHSTANASDVSENEADSNENDNNNNDKDMPLNYENQVEDSVIQTKIQAKDTNKTIEQSDVPSKNHTDADPTTNKAIETGNQAEKAPSDTKLQPVLPANSRQSVLLEKPPSARPIYDDYDEQDDQIQVVVSARKYTTEPNEKTHTPKPSLQPPTTHSRSPFLPSIKEAVSTKPISLSRPNQPIPATNTTRHRSAFMNRLFKTSRPSLKKAALPTASNSSPTSALVSASASTPMTTSPVKSDSHHSKHPVIITKRLSSASSVRSLSNSSAMKMQYQTSDVVPEPRFKRPKIVHETESTRQLIAVEIDQQKEEEEGKSQDQNPSQNKESEEEQNDETSFKIPPWAEDPELEKQLQTQSTMNPDMIFGRIPTLDLQEIFAHLSYNEIHDTSKHGNM